jgi:hypothetical protein
MYLKSFDFFDLQKRQTLKAQINPAASFFRLNHVNADQPKTLQGYQSANFGFSKTPRLSKCRFQIFKNPKAIKVPISDFQKPQGYQSADFGFSKTPRLSKCRFQIFKNPKAIKVPISDFQKPQGYQSANFGFSKTPRLSKCRFQIFKNPNQSADFGF